MRHRLSHIRHVLGPRISNSLLATLTAFTLVCPPSLARVEGSLSSAERNEQNEQPQDEEPESLAPDAISAVGLRFPLRRFPTSAPDRSHHHDFYFRGSPHHGPALVRSARPIWQRHAPLALLTDSQIVPALETASASTRGCAQRNLLPAGVPFLKSFRCARDAIVFGRLPRGNSAIEVSITWPRLRTRYIPCKIRPPNQKNIVANEYDGPARLSRT